MVWCGRDHDPVSEHSAQTRARRAQFPDSAHLSHIYHTGIWDKTVGCNFRTSLTPRNQNIQLPFDLEKATMLFELETFFVILG